VSEAAAAVPGNRFGLAVAALVGAIAAVLAFLAIPAWLAGTNDPDSMASVLYFQRLAAGQQLEVTVLTTPKPILTLVYGLSWNLAHDWRTIVWETIVVHGTGVALAVILASRLAGAAAAAFVAVILVGSSTELAEVAQANSLPWALTGWLIAGVAVTSSPARYGIAGVALLVAGLARIETWLIMGAATLLIAALAIPAIRSRVPEAPPPRAMLSLMVGWLAVPIQLAHDFLLTGDPFYWLAVPRVYTTLVYPDLQPVPLLGYVQVLVGRLTEMPVVVVLAGIGVISLVRTRRWAPLVGLGALVVGGFVLIGSLAVRGIFVSDRYYEEPTIGLLFAAAIGVGAVVGFVARRSAGRVPMRGIEIAGVAAAVAGAILLSVPGPLPPELRERFTLQQAASANLETVRPHLAEIMDSVTGPAPPAVPVADDVTVVDPRSATMYVPRPLSRRVAIELDLALTRLGDGTVVSRVATAEEALVPGQYVYHDANVDAPEEWFAPFEIETESRLGELRLIPLEFSSGEYWLVAIDD
jgi:hypothetical protein